MNQKATKKKPTRCLVPTCFYNKLNANANSKSTIPDPPNWHEITGETKLFYNPILQRQYGSNMDQVKLMICDNHFTYHELIKNLELKLEKAPINHDLIESVDTAIQETGKYYESMGVLTSIFDALMGRLSKSHRRCVDKLSEHEVLLILKILQFFKLIIRNLDNKRVLLEAGLPDLLMHYIAENQLKSSKDDENSKVLVVATCMLLFTSFCISDGEKLGDFIEGVYKTTWSYLSMDVMELQHQTYAFLWALLNINQNCRQKLRREIKFFIKRFNEYKQQWEARTYELFIAFLASLLFYEGKQLIEQLEEEKEQVKEFVDYLEECKWELSDKGKYFAERITAFMQPLFVEKEAPREEEHEEHEDL